MIGFLEGTVQDISGNVVTLNVNGVGYEVRCSQSCIAQLELGEQATIIVHTEVKQDLIQLYGFVDRLEKFVFSLLTRVKGVGAKSASEIVSHIDRRELLKVIAAGDGARLQQVKGIGKKTAQMIIVELRDRVAELASGVPQQSLELDVAVDAAPLEEAREALIALGISRNEAQQAISNAIAGGLNTTLEPGEIVRQALQYI